MGSSGGGGDSTNEIRYAPYIEDYHEQWLGELAGEITTAKLYNPYSTALAYDPSTETDGMLAALNAFCAALAGFHDTSVDIGKLTDAFDAMYSYLTGLNIVTDWQANVASVMTTLDTVYQDDAFIEDSVEQYSEMLQTDIEEKVLPQFEAGMRDANSVMSSTFIIGEALIFAEKDRNVAKYGADLKLTAHMKRNDAIVDTSKYLTEAMLKKASLYMPMSEVYSKFYISGIEFKRLLTHMVVDSLRMIIVANKEETDKNLDIQKLRRMWNIDLYQDAGSLLGSAGGGHAVPKGEDKGGWQSVLGGAASGAAAGFGMGGPWGALAGGVLGGIGGLFS